MVPEILRRCLACGAAVRPGARFCPQCGHNLVAEGAGEAPPVEPAPETSDAPPPWAAGEAAREEPHPLRATREVETASGEATPTAQSPETLAPPTRETFAPPALPTTRETAAQTFDGGVRETPGADGEGARVGFETRPDVQAEAGGGEGPGRSRRAAARVRETVMPRVERMRDEALVVLEDAPDDSGLRFVVIAVFLFGLFLLFLLLSTTVLR